MSENRELFLNEYDVDEDELDEFLNLQELSEGDEVFVLGLAADSGCFGWQEAIEWAMSEGGYEV